ncbi:MAG: hypothetical protein J1F31_03420 [Erysipelotrichales bacterium]|nr:hypothetical protein [Erysipelotrichales bacterium]
MIIFLTVICLFSFSLINFTNTITYHSIDQRFYSALKSSAENSIVYSGDVIYFDKYNLNQKLNELLKRELKDIVSEKYYVYINYNYSDGTACSYRCKNVNIRLKVYISTTATYDKAYELMIG